MQNTTDSADSHDLSPKTLILHIEYGGLGDHLFFSHIPRIAKMIQNNTGGGGKIALKTSPK